MAESIFGAAWWPIHVAVAWALTRDRAFVERSNRAGKSLLSIAVALAMDKVGGKPTERYFKGSTDAWSALREEMAAGNVRASGTPFRRVADLEGGAVNTSGMAREIPAVEIASLRLQDDGNDKDCLVPEDWRVAHGSNWNNLRGYRNVKVFRDDVLRAFDAEGATPYVPDWERLPEAVKRVVATGVNEDQAKQAICTAIADRKIIIRFSIASEEGGASFGEHVVGTVRGGSEIEIPSQLAPNEFNGNSHVHRSHGVTFARVSAHWKRVGISNGLRFSRPTFRRSFAALRKMLRKHWLMVLVRPHHETAARASRRVSVPAARSKSFTPKGCQPKRLNRTQNCVGASARSSSTQVCSAFPTTRS